MAILTGSCIFAGFGGDRILSEKPIDINLPVENEIIIKFPQAVTHTNILTPENANKLTKFLTPEGVLYLTANDAFGKTRMVAEMVNGQIVVLNLRANKNNKTENINIVEPKTENKATTAAKKKNPYKPPFLKNGAAMTKNVQAGQSATVGYNNMVQYGFRHYVGPSRLIGDLKAQKVKVSAFPSSRILRMWSNRLSVKPLAQWRIESQYITVLLVNNRSPYRVPFDPRALRGRFLFSAALYPVIEPQGSLMDQTLWAVVTAEPFNKAIK